MLCFVARHLLLGKAPIQHFIDLEPIHTLLTAAKTLSKAQAPGTATAVAAGTAAAAPAGTDVAAAAVAVSAVSAAAIFYVLCFCCIPPDAAVATPVYYVSRSRI